MRPRTSYGFGIARSLDSASGRARLAELCELLSRRLGVVLFPNQAISYRELSDSLERGTVCFAWLPPLPAIELEDKKRVVPLVLPTRRGNSSYHAALFVRRGVARTLDDLQGKRAAWVEKESAAGYVVPRLHLAANGYDVKRMFSSETFLHSHEAVIDAVVAGRADVGATFCTIDPRTQRIHQAGWTAPDGTSAKPVEVLVTVGPIPNDVIVAATTVPEDLRLDVVEALMTAEGRTKELLHDVLRAESFRTAHPMHFEPLRKMIVASRDQIAGRSLLPRSS